MKKLCPLFLILAFTAPYSSIAQSKQKAETDLLKQLNAILKVSGVQHWAYEGNMSIDSAFAIAKDGTLSVTVRYTTDSSFVRVRMTAPVAEISGVGYDLYLILEYKTPLVILYESDPNSMELKEAGKNTLFHIGLPEKDGEEQHTKLQKAVENVLKYYNG